MPTSFIGGTPQQQTVLNDALAALADALTLGASLPTSPALSTLFGNGTTAATVSAVFSTALSKLSTVTITFDLNNSLPMMMLDGVYLQITAFTSATATVTLWSDIWQRIYLDPKSGQIDLAASLLHELAITFCGLVDFAGVNSRAAAQTLAATAPTSAATCAVNFMFALRAQLDSPPAPCPPGGIAIASANLLLSFYQTLNGSVIGTLPYLLSALTAPPLGYGRLAVFGEGNATGNTYLHAFDLYQGGDLWAAALPQVSGSIDATPVATGNTIWFCTGSGQLVSVDITTPGSPVVRSALTFMSGTSTSRVTSCQLSRDGGTLYAVSSIGVYALTLGAQPALSWSACTTTDFSAHGATLAAGTLLAASAQTLYGFGSNGSTWTLTCPATIQTLLSPGSGQALINGQADTFTVVDVDSRSAVATWTPGITGIDFAKVLLVGNRLFVPTASGQLAAYAWLFIDQPATWSLCWSVTLAQAAATAPVLWGSALIVQDGAGTLSAFDLQTGVRLWSRTGTPVSTSAPLGVSAFVNEADAALYPQANYQGTPALISAPPSPLPAIAALMPGPAGSYALPESGGTALGEVYAPSATLALGGAPTSVSGWGLAQMGALLSRKNLRFDAMSARSWMQSAAINCLASWFVRNGAAQVFGPNVAMIDFDGTALPLARSVVAVVGVGGSGSPVPASVQSALAMSGSTAQDAIQLFPGDLDFTQRVHITAATLAAAQSILGDTVLGRARTVPSVPGITAQLIEVKFGAYPFDFRASGQTGVDKKGSPIAWTPAQIAAGSISGTQVGTGQPATIAWTDAQTNPGWIKFDWIFSNPSQQIVLNTSNVLDPTWQNPAGDIATLDGSQDAFLQEIYLDVGNETLVAALFVALGADLRAQYIEQLELEVIKFGTPHKAKYNLGKVAKRLYNLTRMSGRLLDSIYLQGIFASPITMVYQIWSRIKGVEEAALQTAIPANQIKAQTQALLTVLQGQTGLDASRKQVLAADLQAIINALATTPLPAGFGSLIDTCQADAIAWINTVFSDLLSANSGLQAYFQTLTSRTVSAAMVARKHPRIYEGPDDWS